MWGSFPLNQADGAKDSPTSAWARALVGGGPSGDLLALCLGGYSQFSCKESPTAPYFAALSG